MAERLPSPEELVPHRGIALVLDELVELEPGISAAALWTPDDRYFDGHFPEPDGPVLPGHWTEEAMRLIGCCAVIAKYPGARPRMRADSPEFRHAVLPGETLRVSARFDNHRPTRITHEGARINGLLVSGSAEAAVDGERVCRSKLMRAFFILPESNEDI